jgi:protoporphyrinogen oxidase
VVVLGAGVCGLYAARSLLREGARVTVLERRELVGGLAAGRERNGNYYDFGVHQLHASDPEVFADLQGLMGDRLLPTPKRALIRHAGGYRRYPLELRDLLLGIPPWTLMSALGGLVAQQVRNRLRPRSAASAEEALVQAYGRPLYRLFFRDFTHRYWGRQPAQLSAGFVRAKMPRLSAVDVLRRALGLRDAQGLVESALAEETLYYARTGSRELPMALADDVLAHGGELRLESVVNGIELGRSAGGPSATAVRYLHAGTEIRVRCDAMLSTLPLTSLIEALGAAAPADVSAAAAALAYKALAVYGFLVRRPRVLEAPSVYFRDRIFHRLSEPKHCGLRVCPENWTVLLAETTCEVGDDRFRGGPEGRGRIVAELEAEGLLRASEIAETHVFADEFAYPVFARGFESQLERVRAFLGELGNLRSAGRQGAFAYPNMHGAMRMGRDAAHELLAALAGSGAEPEELRA